MPKPSAINRVAAWFHRVDPTDPSGLPKQADGSQSSGAQQGCWSWLRCWSRLRDEWPVWFGPLCLTWLLFGTLIGRERLAFRDVSHFYTPLYQYVGERCAERPLSFFFHAMWNPHDQTGMPLAGETTTAVFYPTRHAVYLAFSRDDSTLALAIYVWLHLVLASVAAYWSARKFGCQPASSAIAGLAYPLSGAVLFLTTNPPFLVGAAWLPLAMTSLIHRESGSWKLAAISLSMMVLGGDPQTALHVVMMAGLWIATQIVLSNWQRHRERRPLSKSVQWFGRVVAASLFAVMLSAPQIASSVAWASQSGRVAETRSASQTFAFSVGPWRWAELAFPNGFGSPWPIHHRWDRPAFLGEFRCFDALWTPSLYVGTAVFVLVAHAVIGGLVKRSTNTVSFCVMGVFAAFAAMGWYGPWHAPYQWLVDVVPGYDAFRYPSKWLPVVAYVVSMLATLGAKQWHETKQSQHPVSRTSPDSQPRIGHLFRELFGQKAIWVAGPLIVGLSGCVWLTLASIETTPIDSVWGPFQMERAWTAWLLAAIHAWMVFVMAMAIRYAGQLGVSPRKLGCLWMLLVATDLVWAQRSLVPTINLQAEQTAWAAASIIIDPISGTRRWMRMGDSSEFPKSWSESSDAERLLALEVHDRCRWQGRWHLMEHQSVFNSLVSIRPVAMDRFWGVALTENEELNWRNLSAWLGVGGSRSNGGDTETWAIKSTRQHSFDEVETEHRFPWSERIDLASRLGENANRIALEEDAIQGGAPGLIFVSRRIYQDGGWRAEGLRMDGAIQDRSEPVTMRVYRADGVGQGVWCPPGDWTIRWIYDPFWHRPACGLAVVTWALIVASLFRRKRFAETKSERATIC
ncbi:YfhO family protein [Rhodopirellula halodulae]|uniref:YfhO family protein n=1 Tax=Rhodopirellula halodulae TaxID=2894198 RepID=UPI001E4E0F5B|nr:YfhO family protein [Rhodopirellula sp. JC737]MCC9654786.1 YfhO family protein [Rhodopirellula sp. JC737]